MELGDVHRPGGKTLEERWPLSRRVPGYLHTQRFQGFVEDARGKARREHPVWTGHIASSQWLHVASSALGSRSAPRSRRASASPQTHRAGTLPPGSSITPHWSRKLCGGGHAKFEPKLCHLLLCELGSGDHWAGNWNQEEGCGCGSRLLHVWAEREDEARTRTGQDLSAGPG